MWAETSLNEPVRALALIAAVGAVLLVPLAADLLSVEGLVRACSACFVAVYVTATAAGVRLLDRGPRAAAAVAFAAVTVVLAFFGPFLLVPAAIAALYAAFEMTAASRATAVPSSASAR